jgi:hypothetical protein
MQASMVAALQHMKTNLTQATPAEQKLLENAS